MVCDLTTDLVNARQRAGHWNEDSVWQLLDQLTAVLPSVESSFRPHDGECWASVYYRRASVVMIRSDMPLMIVDESMWESVEPLVVGTPLVVLVVDLLNDSDRYSVDPKAFSSVFPRAKWLSDFDPSKFSIGDLWANTALD